ncbi:E3 ubiquitin-protein ligase Mdm2-like isoform X2 [Adelges cooleyi]|uniref:E3 ubiquitin-protein ligase Mdm2-like isoform X2 n=1 Tax=Adelges cooleyi TaxID=133065 RepID=UPI0021804768|nr:E3 ubiquitin-protein ligase Mdm2-like isoform X2 [Adelges cooleyi]
MPPQTLKRQADDVSFNNDDLNDDDFDVTWGGKRTRYIYNCTIQSPDLYTNNYDSDKTESVYSVQSKATIEVVDERDYSSVSSCCGSDCTCNNVNSSQSDHTEFEVVSSSSTNGFDFSTSSSLSTEYEIFNDIVSVDPLLKSDNSYFPDETDVQNVDSKSNLPPPACFKTCLKCKKQNPNPYFQYCYKCFRYRMQIFEDKPLPKNLKQLYKTSNDKTDGSLPNSQESGSFGLSGLQLSQEEANELSDPRDDADKTDNLCNICFLRPKNGIFNHGKTGHIYCCYKCAKQVWNKSDEAI